MTKILAIRADGKKSVVYKTFGKAVQALHSNENAVKTAFMTGKPLHDVKTGEHWYLDECLEPDLKTVKLKYDSLGKLNTEAKNQILQNEWLLYEVKDKDGKLNAAYYLETEAKSFILDNEGEVIGSVGDKPDFLSLLSIVKLEEPENVLQ